MALTRTGANSTASDRATVSAAPLVIATAKVPPEGGMAGEDDDRATRVDPRAQVLGQHQRTDHLCVERQRYCVAGEVLDRAARPR
jgi:hypothetical protein